MSGFRKRKMFKMYPFYIDRMNKIKKKEISCPHPHDIATLYVDPCFKCEIYCNCDLKSDFPDVLVCSLDKQTVRLNSVVVRGSITLQNMIKKFEEENIKVIDLTGDEEEPKVEVVDLRSGVDGNPTFPLTSDLLMKVQNFMRMHLDQIDQAVETEKRTNQWFDTILSDFIKPPKGPVNYFAFENWEAEFFDIDHASFEDIVYARRELLIADLHCATEKWRTLFRGRPMDDDFGTGHYLLEKRNEMDDSGCQDFYLRKPFNPRRVSRHKHKPRPKLTNYHNHRMPRRYIWTAKRSFETFRVVRF